VTDGSLLRGVRHTGDHIYTDSIVMRARSGTVRRIGGEHAVAKLTRFSGREYR
jgi:fructose-1,6-bisphosphatase II